MKIGIINYGMGNIGSVTNALLRLGVTPLVLESPDDMAAGVDKVILPGVGSFSVAMANLRRMGWLEVINHYVRDRGMPLLGICLGMQLLAEESDEGELTAGLSLIPGRVTSLSRKLCHRRIPHVGWNAVKPTRSGQGLFDCIPSAADFYFVHSYVFEPASDDHVAAVTDYGCMFASVVRSGHVAGTQFHPEKSSKSGSQLIRNFLGASWC